jgi:hypothetical protein
MATTQTKQTQIPPTTAQSAHPPLNATYQIDLEKMGISLVIQVLLFLGKSSSSKHLNRNIGYKKPSSARPKRRDANRAERNITGITNMLHDRMNLGGFQRQNQHRVKVEYKNMMVGKSIRGFTSREFRHDRERIVSAGLPNYFN